MRLARCIHDLETAEQNDRVALVHLILSNAGTFFLYLLSPSPLLHRVPFSAPKSFIMRNHCCFTFPSIGMNGRLVPSQLFWKGPFETHLATENSSPDQQIWKAWHGLIDSIGSQDDTWCERRRLKHEKLKALKISGDQWQKLGTCSGEYLF